MNKYVVLLLFTVASRTVMSQGFLVDNPINFHPSFAGAVNTPRINLVLDDNFSITYDRFSPNLKGALALNLSSETWINSGVTTSLIYSPKFTTQNAITIAPSFQVGYGSNMMGWYTIHRAQVRCGILANTDKSFVGIDVKSALVRNHIEPSLVAGHKIKISESSSISIILQSRYSKADIYKTRVTPINQRFDFEIDETLYDFRGFRNTFAVRLKRNRFKLGVGYTIINNVNRPDLYGELITENRHYAFVTVGYQGKRIGVDLQSANLHPSLFPTSSGNWAKFSLTYLFNKKVRKNSQRVL